ncbi:hypothetical protein K2P97_03280 [bacterium]|nr:hypothetical protein [bacterium]
MNYKFTNITKYSLLLLVLINLISLVFFEKSLYYLHNLNQTKYISEVSYDLKKFNLSYLDGMGIFPRQSFIPCFVSPDDSASNYGCTENIQNTKADIIILSGRLASITGTDISNKNYETAAPLLFISKTKKNELIKSSLSKHENLGLPTLLFGFN